MSHQNVQVGMEEEIIPHQPHINTPKVASLEGITSHIFVPSFGLYIFEIVGFEFTCMKEREIFLLTKVDVFFGIVYPTLNLKDLNLLELALDLFWKVAFKREKTEFL